MQNKNKNMKKTKFGYKYNCKGRKTAINKKIAKDLFIISCLYLFVNGTVGMIFTFFKMIKEIGTVSYSINAVKAETIELSPYDQIVILLDKAGVDENFKKNFLCLIKNESNFNSEASSAVKLATGKISVDRGITQVNSQVAPYKITNACAYDLKCSVEKAIDYLKETNKWQKWYGWLHNCQNN
jgi:hypothetical protein